MDRKGKHLGAAGELVLMKRAAQVSGKKCGLKNIINKLKGRGEERGSIIDCFGVFVKVNNTHRMAHQG